MPELALVEDGEGKAELDDRPHQRRHEHRADDDGRRRLEQAEDGDPGRRERHQYVAVREAAGVANRDNDAGMVDRFHHPVAPAPPDQSYPGGRARPIALNPGVPGQGLQIPRPPHQAAERATPFSSNRQTSEEHSNISIMLSHPTPNSPTPSSLHGRATTSASSCQNGYTSVLLDDL